MHLLFVCNGNVCRSPIAERLARAVADDAPLPGLTAESAGVRALAGFPIHPVAAQVLIGLGGDPEGFAARRLAPEMVARADLVLTMTRAIRDTITEHVPGSRERTFTLVEAARIAKLTGATTAVQLHEARDQLTLVGDDIPDPVGLSEESFCQVGDRIAEALIVLLTALHRAPARVSSGV
jgi:protein-tyrosine phosphatase